MLKEFREFIARGNVMDLAVGIIIGAAFTAIVSSLVDDLINPLIGLVTGGVDFSSHVTNLRTGGAQAVMLLMDEEPGSLAIKQIRDAGLKVHLIGTLAMGSDRFLKRLDAQKLDGMVQYNAFPPNVDVPRIKNFAQRYKAKFGEEAHGFAAQSYDATAILMKAIELAAKGGATPTREAVSAAIREVKYSGVTGPVAFDGKGDPKKATYLIYEVGKEWKDNKLVKRLEIAAPAAKKQ